MNLLYIFLLFSFPTTTGNGNSSFLYCSIETASDTVKINCLLKFYNHGPDTIYYPIKNGQLVSDNFVKNEYSTPTYMLSETNYLEIASGPPYNIRSILSIEPESYLFVEYENTFLNDDQIANYSLILRDLVITDYTKYSDIVNGRTFISESYLLSNSSTKFTQQIRYSVLIKNGKIFDIESSE